MRAAKDGVLPSCIPLNSEAQLGATVVPTAGVGSNLTMSAFLSTTSRANPRWRSPRGS